MPHATTTPPPPEKNPGYVLFASLAEWRFKRDKPWTWNEPKAEGKK